MRKSIYVLHERSTKEHFIALESYALLNNVEIKYREFLILRCFAKSILRLEYKLFFQQLKNVQFFITALFSKKKTIIIGIAPLDFHLLILIFFLKKHELFYFTSWCDWSGNSFPKNFSFDSTRLKKTWSNFLKNHIKGAFCVTEASAKSLQKNFDLSCPVAVVSHSINNSITPIKRINSQSGSKKLNLIYVGRLVENKGIKELLSLNKNLDKELFSLKIVGDGPLKNIVQEASRAYSNIDYVGYVKSKRKLFNLYCQSDIQLLFSKKTLDNTWEELFGIVIIEAMYCGVPTIATSHVGPKSIIDHGVNGFLVDEKNIIEETKKILEEKLFMNKEFIDETQLKAKKYYKTHLVKKWGEILDA